MVHEICKLPIYIQLEQFWCFSLYSKYDHVQTDVFMLYKKQPLTFYYIYCCLGLYVNTETDELPGSYLIQAQLLLRVRTASYQNAI